MILINYGIETKRYRKYEYDILFIDKNKCTIVLKFKSGIRYKALVKDYIDNHVELSIKELKTFLANKCNLLAIAITSDSNIIYYELVNYDKYVKALSNSNKLKAISIKYPDLD